MREFIYCTNDYGYEDWEEFKRNYSGAKIEDSGYKLKIEYKDYTCFIMYEVTDHYSLAWFRKIDNVLTRLADDDTTNDAKELMGWFVADCIHFFRNNGVEAAPLPPVFGEPANRRGHVRHSTQQQPLPTVFREPGGRRGRTRTDQRCEFKQEINPNNVISMLYELRDMCRSMHDGARTLR